MRETSIKKFVEEFLKLNNIKHTLDSKGVYTTSFEGLLANKLGKNVKFTFSRQTAEDFGAEYAHAGSHIIKTLSAFAISQGLITRAKLIIKNKEKFDFDKNINFQNSTEESRFACAFLFKIASSNRITEDEPEKLRYLVVNQDESVVEEVGELIEPAEKLPSTIKISNEQSTKMFKQATSHLEQYLEFINTENEKANLAHYNNWLNEARARLNEVKRDCLKNEEKLKNEITEAERLAYVSSRVRNPEKHYETKRKLEKELEELKIKNEELTEKEIISFTKRAEQEKVKYFFTLSIDLCSVLIFEYPAQKYKINTIKNPKEHLDVVFSKLTNKLEPFFCPGCKKLTQQPYGSYEGWLCCANCSSLNPILKTRISTRDKVKKCIITGELVLQSDKFKCNCCHNYFKQEYLKKDFENKLVCDVCGTICPFTGKVISKNKGVFCEDIQKRVHPAYALKCYHTQTYHSKANIVLTTGDYLTVNKKDVIVCKKLGLSFARKNTENGLSILYVDAQELKRDEIEYAELKNQIHSKIVKSAKNKHVAICIEKRMFTEKIHIYDIKKKRLIV